MSGEAYVKRYPGGFVDLPATSTAIDSSYLNGTEAALARLLGADPADANLMVWDQSLGRFKTALLTNAHVAAAAAISRTKLDFGAGLVDADIAPGAAVAQSKIAGLVAAFAGLARPPTYGTTPPGSPADGDEWILPFDATGGVMWRFRYRTASPNAEKWEFVGGSQAYVAVDTGETTTSATFTDLATIGPSITVPRSGRYLLTASVNVRNATAGGYGQVGYKVGAAAANGILTSPSPTASDDREATSTVSFACVASDLVKLQYASGVGGQTTSYFRRRLQIWPVRVS